MKRRFGEEKGGSVEQGYIYMLVGCSVVATKVR